MGFKRYIIFSGEFILYFLILINYSILRIVKLRHIFNKNFLNIAKTLLTVRIYYMQ